MRITQLISTAAVILSLTAPAWTLDVDNPPNGVFVDEWYAIMLQGQKSGYMHQTMERVRKAGSDLIRSRTEMLMEVGRGGQKLEVKVIEASDETLSGQPVTFSHRMNLGNMPGPTVDGEVKNNKVVIRTMQFGQRAEPVTYDLPEGAVMTWGTYREAMKRGLKPGTAYELKLYAPSLVPNKLVPTTVKVLKKETIDLFGRKVEAVKIAQTMRIQGAMAGAMEVETLSWLNDSGDTLRLEMTMMNMPIEIFACPKSFALQKNNPAELMLETLIHPDKPVDPNTDKARYRITLKPNAGKGPLPNLPETGMQQVRKQSDKAIELLVTRQPHGLSKGHSPLPDAERYLAPHPAVNYKDPKVAELAKKAVGREKDPWKQAEKLTRFVGNYVQTKSLNVGFATAGEVARSREGDCSEHGILLAALGRAVGIPTRVVTGIVYAPQFAGQNGVFVGHLWTEFWIQGQWVDFDAALGQVVVDPAHIALGVNDAGDTGFADMASALWMSLGRIEIAVLEGGLKRKPTATESAPAQ